VGTIISAWKNGKNLDAVLKIDNNSIESMIASSCVQLGKCQELSLGYVVEMEMSDNGMLSGGKKRVTEVSLVKKGTIQLLWVCLLLLTFAHRGEAQLQHSWMEEKVISLRHERNGKNLVGVEPAGDSECIHRHATENFLIGRREYNREKAPFVAVRLDVNVEAVFIDVAIFGDTFLKIVFRIKLTGKLIDRQINVDFHREHVSVAFGFFSLNKKRHKKGILSAARPTKMERVEVVNEMVIPPNLLVGPSGLFVPPAKHPELCCDKFQCIFDSIEKCFGKYLVASPNPGSYYTIPVASPLPASGR
jgi:hypothetical protein